MPQPLIPQKDNSEVCSTCWAGLPSGNGTRVPQAVRHLVSFSYFFHSCLWDITPYTGKQCPPHSCLPSPYLEIRSLQALPLTLRTWGGAVPALREAAQVCTGNVHSSLCQRQQTRKPPAPQNCPCCDEAHPEAAPPPSAQMPLTQERLSSPSQAGPSQLQTLIRPGLQSAHLITTGIELRV